MLLLVLSPVLQSMIHIFFLLKHVQILLSGVQILIWEMCVNSKRMNIHSVLYFTSSPRFLKCSVIKVSNSCCIWACNNSNFYGGNIWSFISSKSSGFSTDIPLTSQAAAEIFLGEFAFYLNSCLSSFCDFMYSPWNLVCSESDSFMIFTSWPFAS